MVINSCSINEMFVVKYQGGSIGFVYRASGNSESQPFAVMEPRPLAFAPQALSSHCLWFPSSRPVGDGGHHYKVWNLLLEPHLVVNRAWWGRMGVVMVCGFLQKVQECLAWPLWC